MDLGLFGVGDAFLSGQGEPFVSCHQVAGDLLPVLVALGQVELRLRQPLIGSCSKPFHRFLPPREERETAVCVLPRRVAFER